MEKITKQMIGVSALILCTIYVVQRILLWAGYQTFDYCVTHVCGNTHNFGFQDGLWILFNSLTILCGFAIAIWWLGYLKENPVGVV